MSQHYAPVDLLDIAEDNEVDMEVGASHAADDDDNSKHSDPVSGATVSSTVAYIATNRQQQQVDEGDEEEDDEEAEEAAAEFDPLFEFTDDIPEKPTNSQMQVRASSNNNKVWQVVGSINWPKVLRFTATYLALPFITGVMAGMGEIFANEFMYRWGWRGARPIAVAGRNGRVFPVADTTDKARDIANAIHEL
ncbi:hypothetical protein GGF44_004703 [Coemansia sp. RSA 1694]|nr:hypothetical protein GGF44_004703 [Coemansia sp. RSA 1694]